MPKTSRHKFDSATTANQLARAKARQEGRPTGKPVRGPANGAGSLRDTQKFHRQLGFYRRRFHELIRELDTLFEKISQECGGLRNQLRGGAAKAQPPLEMTEDQIKAMAYFIWEGEGRPAGREKDHWSMAIERLQRSHQGGPGA